MTGPPGSGKTTLARPLAQRLRLPLLSKDDIKEALAGAVQPAEGSRVGTLLDALVRTRDPSLRLKNACGQDDAIRDGQDPALNAPLGTSPILGNLRES